MSITVEPIAHVRAKRATPEDIRRIRKLLNAQTPEDK